MKNVHFLTKTRLWLIVHAVLFAAAFLSVMCNTTEKTNRTLGDAINTNLLDMIPSSSLPAGVRDAEKIFSGNSARRIVLAASHADFFSAKKAAENLYMSLNENTGIASLVLYDNLSAGSETVDNGDSLRDFFEYVYAYRYVLLSKQDRNALASGNSENIADIAAAAQAQVFGAFSSMLPLPELNANLDTDPFFLAGNKLNELLSLALNVAGGVSVRDGVLAAEHEGKWYVLLRGELSAKGASIGSNENAVRTIYASCEKLQSEDDTVEFLYSGVPFHSYESSTSAQKEVSIISTISLTVILILFIFVFRSILQGIVIALTASLSCITGAAAVLLFFGQIHILTFVFGTALIGTCVDYAIHFLCIKK
ncbi:MAG: hypothetical protein Ta2A_22770 [Treponemataceae bacterium]|nr:MAG: hypothetical protein Ta2A_22770 [Treponemataceae bacterium]